MTSDELKAYQKKLPFNPFRLVLADGKTYDVLHPNFMWVWGGTVHVGTHGDLENGFCDRSDRLALTSVKEVESLAPTLGTDGAAGH